MSGKRLVLTQDDVKRLLSEAKSPESRMEIATKVSQEFVEGELSESEKDIAREIFRIMVRDAEVRVREVLSQQLKESHEIPRDVALKLAHDVESVSLPIIEFSNALTDEDLIEIINSQSENKQIAVAKRRVLSEKVSDVLIETNSEKVVETLVRNDGTKIAEPSLNRVFDRFRHKENIQEGLAYRKTLPIAIAEKLVTQASAKIQEHLVASFDFAPDLASDIIMQAREKATVGLLNQNSSSGDVKRLVEQLYRNGRLTASIILRAVCTGDMAFFEVSLARLAGIPLANARVLIHDAGPLGMKSLYEKAKLPGNLYRAFRVAIDVYHNTEMDGYDTDRKRFMQTMIERILTQVDDIDATDLDYLMGKLSKISGGDVAFS